jgi:acyl-CoA hydrolase
LNPSQPTRFTTCPRSMWSCSGWSILLASTLHGQNGTISAIVPLVSHQDHSEHSVQVFITEQGVADLRGRSPAERARLTTDNCAHPDYRDDLRRQLESMKGGHEPLALESAFAFYDRFKKTGTMRDPRGWWRFRFDQSCA